MNNLILHTGSNIGNREDNLHRCAELLNFHVGPITSYSRIFATEAWGVKDQPEFYNQALMINTSKSAKEIHQITKKIEYSIGNEKEYLWGPRKIDIDIIFFGNNIINKKRLIIPHPRMNNRRFVLVPLMDIIPDFIHPVEGVSIKEMYTKCDDLSYVHSIQLQQPV